MAKVREITVSVAEGRALIAKGVQLRGATLSQTMGPNWKDLVWVVGYGGTKRTPFVSASHSHRDIAALLAVLRPSPGQGAR